MRGWGGVFTGITAQTEAMRERLPGLVLSRYVWLVVVLAAAGWYLAAHWAEIFSHPLVLSAVTFAFVLTLTGKVFAVLQVRFALAHCGQTLPFGPSFYAYSMADVSKYIPGGIWSVVSRVGLYRALRLGARVIIQALVIEQIWYIGSAAAIGLALYGMARWGHVIGHGDAYSFVTFAGPILIWAIVLVVGNRFTTMPAAPRATIVLLATQLCLWLLLGAGFAVLLTDDASTVVGAGAFLLAFAAGMAVPFAPGGIGVREAVALVLLLPFQPAETIGYELLLSRAVWVVADITFAAIVMFTCRRAWRAAIEARGGQST